MFQFADVNSVSEKGIKVHVAEQVCTPRRPTVAVRLKQDWRSEAELTEGSIPNRGIQAADQASVNERRCLVIFSVW